MAVHVPFAEMGATAVDAFVEQLLGAEPHDAVGEAPPEVVVCASTAPPRRDA
jgi:DNA-binding LacI/PurR family transcriptional regulator